MVLDGCRVEIIFSQNILIYFLRVKPIARGVEDREAAAGRIAFFMVEIK